MTDLTFAFARLGFVPNLGFALIWALSLRVRARLKRVGQEHLVDALVPRGDEGRGTLRKAVGSCEQALIRGCPNGETRPFGVILC